MRTKKKAALYLRCLLIILLYLPYFFVTIVLSAKDHSNNQKDRCKYKGKNHCPKRCSISCLDKTSIFVTRYFAVGIGDIYRSILLILDNCLSVGCAVFDLDIIAVDVGI